METSLVFGHHHLWILVTTSVDIPSFSPKSSNFPNTELLSPFDIKGKGMTNVE